MDPITIGLLSLAVVTALILLGLHIGVALAATSFLGVYLISGRFNVAVSLLGSTAYNAVADYVFAVIPLFVLMGLLAMASGATRELFDAAKALLGRTSGGVGIATVVANAIFAAVTGVSVASAAIFSRIAVPEMNRLNYNHRFSLGIVASSALLGMLIPPSVLMIVYALLTDQSIGALFAAGVVPGLLVAFALSFTIWLAVRLNPALGGGGAAEPELPRGGALRALVSPWAIYLLIAVVLGGIYGGVFTPTEAGAMGAIGAFALYVMRGRFKLSELGQLLLETGRATASIFFLFIAASLYSRMLAVSGLPVAAATWVVDLNLPPMAVVLAFMVVILIMGCFIDSVSILLLSMPIMVPVIQALGYDLIWFGIVAIVAVEIGLLTPPFGMVLFVMKASLPYKVDVTEIMIGVLPFIGVLLVVLAILIAFPWLTLALPNLLF